MSRFLYTTLERSSLVMEIFSEENHKHIVAGLNFGKKQDGGSDM
jgi:hypothetical protein